MTMPKSIVPVTFRSRDVLLSVCAKCDGDGRALRRAIKRELKARGRGKSVRVVASTCLDICPKRAVGIAIVDRRADAGGRYFAIDDRDVDIAQVIDLIA